MKFYRILNPHIVMDGVRAMQKDYLLCKENANMLKGILAIGIVLHHLALRTQTVFVIDLLENLGAPIVSVFFFISGYGLLSSYIKKENYFKNFLSHRFTVLLIPFFTSIFIFQVLYALDYGTNSVNQILTLLIIKGDTFQLLPFSWYVFCALFLYLTFYFIFKYVKYSTVYKIGIMIFVSICYIAGLTFLSFGPHWYTSILGFSAGLIFKYYEKNILKLIRNRKNGILISFGILFLIKLLGVYNYSSMMLYPVFVILLLFVLNPKEYKLTKILGEISYEIYLLQGILIVFLRGNFVNVENDFIYFSLTISLTIISSIILHYSINKYLQQKWLLTIKSD